MKNVYRTLVSALALTLATASCAQDKNSSYGETGDVQPTSRSSTADQVSAAGTAQDQDMNSAQRANEVGTAGQAYGDQPPVGDQMEGTDRYGEQSGMDANTGMAGQPGAASDRLNDANRDQAFYRDALTRGEGEVDLATYASENAASDEVRDLAKTLRRDHAALNDKLRSASGLGDDEMSPAKSSSASSLKSKKGEQFDSAYLDHEAKGHQETIKLFENAARNSQDEQTRQLAQNALDDLRKHAAEVDRLRTRTGDASARTSDDTAGKKQAGR